MIIQIMNTYQWYIKYEYISMLHQIWTHINDISNMKSIIIFIQHIQFSILQGVIIEIHNVHYLRIKGKILL